MASPTKSLRADSRATRECIMVAAVELFAEKGFDATSMRSIAETAQVNLAAINYHFGSKIQLFEAAILRCAAPINAERIRQLDALQARTATPSVAQVVNAFVNVGLVEQGGQGLARLIARLFVEPQTVSKPLLEQVFAPTVARFISALRLALPQVDAHHLEWRFHFLVGAMLQLLRLDTPLRLPGVDRSTQLQSGRQIEELIKFVVAGLRQDDVEYPTGSTPRNQ